MKSGELIFWNAVSICEIFKISWKTGKHFLKGDSENHFEGPVFPFGAMVEYHPIPVRDRSRLHQFGKKVFPGIFLGCELIAERIWKGNILIADSEDSEKQDASEIYLRRINAKEVLVSQKGEQFIFPVVVQQNCWRNSKRTVRASTSRIRK